LIQTSNLNSYKLIYHNTIKVKLDATLFSTDPKYFRENHILIEMDDNELTSAGEGCMSVILSSSMMTKRNELATKILNTCGYSHIFKNKEFYAIDWNKKLEVKFFND